MRRQPLPDALENLDFHIRINSACIEIANEVCSGAYTPRLPLRLLSEKSRGLCRQLVIPSAKDALVLQTLSDALWEEIKNKAPTKNALYAPDDHSFSKLVKGHSGEYGSLSAWLNFQRTIFGFAKRHRYVVVTDIANYYDFISYDHLRNVLSDLSLAREHSLDLLIYALSHMLWQPDYMPRVQIGLPQIHLDGARLLAHCFLFEVDKVIVRRKGIEYARYMDDIDIGVDSLVEGKAVLRDIDLALQTRQIRLNSGKTKILTDKEARLHYRIRHNAYLDKLEVLVETRLKSGKPISSYQKFITKFISFGLLRDRFSSGNGEKILKRCINYAREFKANIEDIDFLQILCDWPGCRLALLQWWQHSATSSEKLTLLNQFVSSSHIVDDITFINLAIAISSARLPANLKTELSIRELCGNIDPKTKWGYYANLWILSKYGSNDELFSIVDKGENNWSTSEQLSRTVASLYPRFVDLPQKAPFEGMLRRSNFWVRSALEFEISLTTTVSGLTAIKPFVTAPNPSLPNRITHSKFLMVLGLLKNPSIAPTAAKALQSVHSYALSDGFYQLLV